MVITFHITREVRLGLTHLMNTDGKEPIFKEESDVLIGCAMAVHNGIGYGFHEKPYENGLVVEFRFRDRQDDELFEGSRLSFGIYN